MEYNKKKYKEIALNIIKEHDSKIEYNLAKVSDFVKIGEWIKENINYNRTYHGRQDISALEIYNNRAGVCHHITVLYNALLYSLGYQCIYVCGFAVNNNDNNYFSEDNSHAWSLIKVNDKWLPLDATWGIFSGKLPVTHFFEYYFSSNQHTSGTDYIKFGETKVKGHIYGI